MISAILRTLVLPETGLGEPVGEELDALLTAHQIRGIVRDRKELPGMAGSHTLLHNEAPPRRNDAMKGYGQFCPLAFACEIVGEKWMPLVLRELLLGGRRFNDIQRGVPRM
ncbi:MAG: winged helix-turn-helix transcriptional regulator [Gammaproteobacteria bacterium]|nr:winged helix-turn-helix transcriptional regulator [Gammaproteobacteria bacterium]